MNIGIDIRPLMTPIRTGVGEYTYELLSALFEIDRKNQYFLFYNSYQNIDKNLPSWKYDNVRFVANRWPNKIFNFCQKFLKWPKIDKLLLKNLDYFFSPNLNFTALSKNVKKILTIHDLSYEFFPEFFPRKQPLWNWFINPQKQCLIASVILAPSENTKQDLINFYKIPENKIKVIYPGLSSIFTNPTLPSPYQREGKNLPDNYILFLGSIEPRKNILAIIEAYEKAFNNLPLPYNLVIAGAPGWKNKEIFKKIENSPLKQKINFIGYIKNEDKPELYRRAAVFVYPSFYEGFGFPVLESMHNGVPVITSNRSSLPEITGSSAWLVDPNKPEQITVALISILKNEKIKNEMTVKAKEKAAEFSWKKAAEEFLNIMAKNV